MRPSQEGMRPVSKLFFIFNIVNDDRVPNSQGIDPGQKKGGGREREKRIDAMPIFFCFR
jgi:hypothetical protein